MTMYPIILPVNTNSNSDISLVQECIESEGNSDILKKYISQEELSEEEKDRIVECVDGKREIGNTVAGVVIAVIALVVLAMIVFAVWCFIATR